MKSKTAKPKPLKTSTPKAHKTKLEKLVLKNPELGKPQKWDDFIKLLGENDLGQFQIHIPTKSGGTKKVSTKHVIQEMKKMSKRSS